MGKKLKIIHIINNLGIGGAERVLLLLLEELSKRKDLEITLISLEGHGDLEEDFKKLPITFKKFNYNLFVPLFRRVEPYFRLRLFWYVLKQNPDVIHGHLIKGEDFAKILGGLLKKPVITTSHDCYIHPGKKQRFLNRFLYKGVAVSKVVADHLEEKYEISKDRIMVIPNAIKVNDFNKSYKEFDYKNPVFIYVGRLIDVKGVQFAIKGLANLRVDYPNIKFLIYGYGWYKEELKKIVKENNYSFVKFCGVAKDVPGALSKGDIFLMPSKSEGFSMAALEAIAAGKAIIATKTGAIPQMISEGENGYFVKYGSSEEIEITARKLINKDFKIIQKKSTELAKSHFSIEKVGKMYYNLYLEVLENK